MLFAFDSKTCGLLHRALACNGVAGTEKSRKSYVALVRGDWNRKFTSDEVVAVNKPLKVKEEMKDSATEFRLLASNPMDDSRSPGACSLLLCIPKTGRTHQIRRHLQSLSLPIIGDTEHGDSKINRWWRQNRSLDRLFLHCLSLDLPPMSTFDETKREERIECVAPLPPDLRRVMEHEDMGDLWNVARGKCSSLSLEFFDERGGSFGRNYSSSRGN